MQKLLLIAAILIALLNVNYLSILLQGGTVTSSKYMGGMFMLSLVLLFMWNFQKDKLSMFKIILIILLFVNLFFFYFKNK
ncbi:hypothetical protein [Runella limosa]|uniref:hypothetical protein n=1 Tax=Runella limosa TaxID=370978 RepID=UPI0003F6D86E|nr:hypothetical protein [Runella limosa]